MSARTESQRVFVGELHGETVATAVICHDRSKFGPLAVTELSAGGATLTGALPVAAAGSHLRVLLQLENRRRPVALWGRVTWCVHDPAGQRCRVAFSHRFAATEDLLHRVALSHLERLRSRLPVVMVLDGGELIRTDLGRDLLALGYNPLFFSTTLEAIWWAEQSGSTCKAIMVDSGFVVRSRERVLDFFAEHLPAARRLLVVRGVQEVPQALFGAVHGILGKSWRASELGAALSPLTTLLAPRRILFVDDEPKVLAGLQGRLRKDLHGWHSVWATSAEAALAEFHSTPFDVVVTDIRMPGMDGIELLTAIKRLHPRVRGVVLSGYETPGCSAVADVVLRKPCPMSVLRHAALNVAEGMEV